MFGTMALSLMAEEKGLSGDEGGSVEGVRLIYTHW